MSLRQFIPPLSWACCWPLCCCGSRSVGCSTLLRYLLVRPCNPLTRRSQCPLAQRRTDKTMARIISFALALMLVSCQPPVRFAEARTTKKPVVHEQTQPKEEQKPKCPSENILNPLNRL